MAGINHNIDNLENELIKILDINYGDKYLTWTNADGSKQTSIYRNVNIRLFILGNFEIHKDFIDAINKINNILNDLGQNLYIYHGTKDGCDHIETKKEILQAYKIGDLSTDINGICTSFINRYNIKLGFIDKYMKKDFDKYIKYKFIENKLGLN